MLVAGAQQGKSVLYVNCCSVAQLCLTVWDPPRLQHARLPCPSLFPGVCSNSCSLSQWCHPTTSSSVVPFTLSQHQGLFQMNWLFASRGQSIGASASASVLPTNIQDWFPLGWTGLIYLQPKGRSSLLQHHNSMFPCKITGLVAEEGEWLQRRQNPRLPHLPLFLTLSLPVTLQKAPADMQSWVLFFQSKKENTVPPKDK